MHEGKTIFRVYVNNDGAILVQTDMPSDTAVIMNFLGILARSTVHFAALLNDGDMEDMDKDDLDDMHELLDT